MHDVFVQLYFVLFEGVFARIIIAEVGELLYNLLRNIICDCFAYRPDYISPLDDIAFAMYQVT